MSVRPAIRVRRIIFALPLAAVMLGSYFLRAEQPPAANGVLLSLNHAGGLEITAIDSAAVERTPPAAGLLVWAKGDEPERWAIVGPGWRLPAEAEVAALSFRASDVRRGGAGSIGQAGIGQFTVQLEQINPETATRNVGIYPLTPAADGRLLSPRPTFRRQPLSKEPRFPAATAQVTSDNLKEPLIVAFAAGQDRVTWDDFQGLPKELADGLPPGRYVFGPRKGMDGVFVTFIVDEPSERESILRRVNDLAGLLGTRTDPLYLQFAFDHLLSVRGENDTPLYLGDVLDLLESVPDKSLTPHLRRQREHLVRCLQVEPGKRGEAMMPTAAPGDDTGIAEIDDARRWIASSQWQKAVAALDRPALAGKSATNRRATGLAALYRGVVLSEAGLNKEAEARGSFEKALEFLKSAGPADRLRAQVNYANFLQRLATDRVHNHALQMAAGVPQPFLTALRDCLSARDQYRIALELAEQEKLPGQAAAIRVNAARLHALLADVIRTLGGFAPGEQSAIRASSSLASAAAESSEADFAVRAVAEEVRALLAYRVGDRAATSAAAHRAMKIYLDHGQLAGVENAYRLLGLVAGGEENAKARRESLRAFQIAHLISESLRERFPPDRAGLTRAGFFARKAYVSDRIVEILLQENRPAEALEYLEKAKARGLQDLLATRGQRTPVSETGIAKLLANWPSQTAAVEYFLGTDRVYAVVVNPRGKVSIHVLHDEQKKPLEPRELIARVQQFLVGIERQAGKLYVRLTSRRGYDNGWQDDLHRFHNELLPPAIREELRSAKVVVIVPQHILHYFPFAALVTARDAKQTNARMAHPRFLIDEPFDLVMAPSLTAWRRLPAATARHVSAIGVADAPGAPALDGVKKDLDYLRKVFGPQLGVVLDGENARESAVKKLLATRGMLFFAAHGLNHAERPLESHLMLMADEDDPPANALEANDGRLTAGEIFTRRINADLVVMSACYSGLGERSPLPGDELFGLQRAFLHAGSRTVVAGLWDVYDGTAPELMKGFFQRFIRGEPAATALAGSQRAFLADLRASKDDEPWLHPYFWAVYTVAGDDRTRFEK